MTRNLQGWRTDAVFTVVLVGFALAGLRTTYAGWMFLAVGGFGMLLGLLASLPVTMGRQPVVAVAGIALLAYAICGSAVVEHQRALAGLVPTPGSLRALGTDTVRGWKDLLTTLPPVAASGSMLVVPLVLGIVGVAGGLTVARRLSWSAAPVVAPVAVLAAVIALGTHQPGERLLDGVVFAALALVWIAIRARRRQKVTGSSRALVSRAVAGAAVLGVAGLVALVAAPVLPGDDTADRVVLRDHITPPFDLSDYPSPLVGFRKYTGGAKQLYDQTLFTEHGLPANTPMRIATLDDYDGSVWGAVNVPGDDFQRVGVTIPGTASGTAYTVRVTVAPAYAAATDVNPWLPNAGDVTRLDFTGPDAGALSGGFRFNLATSSGIAPARLRAGDTYAFRMVADDVPLPADAQPYGQPQLTDAYSSLVAARTAQWTKGATGFGPQLRAVAAYFVQSGKYSDGGAKGEGNYLPGHSVGRLTSFFNGTAPVGDDEQYAAAFALIANYLGMPARVVLGALPEPDGTVRGVDVHAWVEVHLAGGAWATIPTRTFTPPTAQTPHAQPPIEAKNTNAAVVPPPNAVHPPTSYVDDGSSATQQSGRNRTAGGASSSPFPPFVRQIVEWSGPPVLLVAAVLAAIVGGKASRRKRRRTRGSPANRCAQGWRELVDQARDLGDVVPSGWTRRQEASVLSDRGIAPLADAVDAVVYGPDDPAADAVEGLWRQVDAARRAMAGQVPRLRRWRAAVSLRSLRPRAAGSPLDPLAVAPSLSYSGARAPLEGALL